jgi:hypothetical protein
MTPRGQDAVTARVTAARRAALALALLLPIAAGGRSRTGRGQACREVVDQLWLQRDMSSAESCATPCRQPYLAAL